MDTFPVIHSTNYSITIGAHALDALNQFLTTPTYKEVDFYILVDENTLQHCIPLLIQKVPVLGKAEIIETESGEQSKTIEMVTQLWLTLSEQGANRQSVLINLGGGVICDLGGFTAGTFKRGIRYINVPTTLLAQVDASVGGKTGIDLNYLKNEVGLFSNPEAVFIVPEFLKTLDERQLLSGYAEMIKHALIADKNYWNLLIKTDIFSSDGQIWSDLIQRSIRIKNEIVIADPHEQSLRKALNFGHTIGHALESYALENDAPALLHGEAIAIGIICEAFLSVEKAGLTKTALKQLTGHILSHFQYVRIDKFNEHRLLELMKHDKKNEKGKIHFTLLSDIGTPVLNKICTREQIVKSLGYYRRLI